MPELGKATYFLILDSQQFDAGLEEADATATKYTTQIGQKLGMIGEEAQVAAGEVNTAGSEMAAGFDKVGTAAGTAGAEAKAGSGEVVAAADTAAAGVTTASAAGATAWGKMGTSIGAMGTKSFGVWKLAGLAAIYGVAKGGIDWLKETNQYTHQFNTSLKATGDVAGVSEKSLLKFSDTSEALAANGGRQAVLQLQAMLLGFTHIRNEGTGAAAIFDRVRQAALDISAQTGRSLTTVAVALGKAFQDPVKYMNTLGRAGVTFSKQQQMVVENLLAAGKPLQAQEYMLQQLSRYTGQAQARTHTFSGELAIEKGHLEESSSVIVRAFIPAFNTFLGLLQRVAGFLSQHANLVKDITLAYIGWKVATLGVGLAMKAWNLATFTAQIFGIGTASKEAAAQTDASMAEMKGVIGSLQTQVAMLQRQLIALGPATEEGAATGMLALRGFNTSLVGTRVAAAETSAAVETDMAGVASSAGAATTEVAGLRLGLLGVAGMVVTAAILLDIIPHSSAGQNDLNKIGMGFLGHVPVLGGLFSQSARFGNYLRGVLGEGSLGAYPGPPKAPKGYDARSYGQAMSTRANPGGYLKSGSAADRAFRRKHPHGVTPHGYGANAPGYSNAYYNWLKTHPGGTVAEYEQYKKAQKALYHALHPGAFSLSPSATAGQSALDKMLQGVSPSLATQSEKLEEKYMKALLTPKLTDDRNTLGQEMVFYRGLLKNRKLTADDRTQVLKQMDSTHAKLVAVDKAILTAAGGGTTGLDKVLGPEWQKLDIAQQQAQAQGAMTGKLDKDKKALENEENFLKGVLQNRKLSLTERQKIQHELTSVEDKIAAVDKKMYDTTMSGFRKGVEAFEELQGTFFGQFAPNVFSQTPKGLTPGSKHVMPRKVQHHALGGVVHYATGGAVSTRIVREAPHHASTEARYYAAGRRWFEHNAPHQERRGTDTVPAMLTPGELVLNSNQQRRLRAKLGLPTSGSPEALFSAIQSGGARQSDAELVMRVARHQISMSRGGSQAPYRSDISTWLRQFAGMSQAQKNAAASWWGSNYGEIRRGYASGGPVSPRTAHNHPGIVVHHHHHHHVAPPRAVPQGSSHFKYSAPRGEAGEIARMAKAYGLDPRAVLGVASGEGLGGGIGDRGTSFGPWQLHWGGAFPRWAPQGSAAASQAWAWSRAGMRYAMQQMAHVARGLKGNAAAWAIIKRFERPRNPMSDFDAYLSYSGGANNRGYNNYARGYGRGQLPKGMSFDRIDQGVDLSSNRDYGALAAGKIVHIDPNFYNGTAAVYERLAHAIKIGNQIYREIYYSETSPLVKVGQRVRAGQAVIGAGNAEIGFARNNLPAAHNIYKEGMQTAAGKQFWRYLQNQGGGRSGKLRMMRRGNRLVLAPDAGGGGPLVGNYNFGDTGIAGLVPGATLPQITTAAVPGMDSVPALLTPGEMVLNSDQQDLLRQKLGLGAMNSPAQLFAEITNTSHMMHGGPVGGSPPPRHHRAPRHYVPANVGYAQTHPYHRPHVSSRTGHNHPETQGYEPHYYAPHVSAADAYHHPEISGYGPVSHSRSGRPLGGREWYLAHPDVVVAPYWTGIHARGAYGLGAPGSYMHGFGYEHPDAGGGFSLGSALGSIGGFFGGAASSAGGWLHRNLGMERNYGKLGTFGVGLGHFVGHLGYQLGAGNYDFWRGFGRPHSTYTERSNRIANSLITQQLQNPLQSLAMTTAHPGRNPLSTLAMALMVGVPELRGPIEGLDYEANARVVLGRMVRRQSAGMGAASSVDRRIWENVLGHPSIGKSGWKIPDSSLWRGKDPVEAIHYNRMLARQYRGVGPWYDAVRLTLQDSARFEGVGHEPFTGAFGLLSPRQMVPRNLETAILSARIAKGADLTAADFDSMGLKMHVWKAQIPRINQMFREGAVGLSNKKLGLSGDIPFEGGMKVPSFVHNLMNPDSQHVTVDTIAADSMFPGAKNLMKSGKLSLGQSYHALAEIYRQIGHEEGMKPMEAQAASWIPHRIAMRSLARGGAGLINASTIGRSAIDFIDKFGEFYGSAAQRSLERKINRTGYGGGLGIVGGASGGMFGREGIGRYLFPLSEAGRRLSPFSVSSREADSLPINGPFLYHGTSAAKAAEIIRHRLLRAGESPRSMGLNTPAGAWVSSDPAAAAFWGDSIVGIPKQSVLGRFRSTRFGLRYSSGDVPLSLMNERRAAAFNSSVAQIFGEIEPHPWLYPAENATYPRNMLAQARDARATFAAAAPHIKSLAKQLDLNLLGVRPQNAIWDGSSQLGYVFHVGIPKDGFTPDFETRLQGLTSGIGKGFDQGSLSYGVPLKAGMHGKDVYQGIHWMGHVGDAVDAQRHFDRISHGAVGFMQSPIPHGYYIVNFGLGADRFQQELASLGMGGKDLSWRGSYTYSRKIPSYGMSGVSTFENMLARGGVGAGRTVSQIRQSVLAARDAMYGRRFGGTGGLGITGQKTVEDVFHLPGWKSRGFGSFYQALGYDEHDPILQKGSTIPQIGVSGWMGMQKMFMGIHPAFGREYEKFQSLLNTGKFHDLPMRKQETYSQAMERADMAMAAIADATRNGNDLYLAHNKFGEMLGAMSVDVAPMGYGTEPHWEVPYAGAVGGAGSTLFRKMLKNAADANVGLSFSGLPYSSQLYALVGAEREDEGFGSNLTHFNMPPSMVKELAKNPLKFLDRSMARPKFSTGGAVPGTGNTDSVSAMLTPGELVLNQAQQVLLRQRLGLQSLGSPSQLFNEIAARHYAAGGVVEGLDLGGIGAPSLRTTATPSLGYAMRRDIARLVGVVSRAREIDQASSPSTMHYEQHNTYEEIPKDKFAQARQMKIAAEAAFMT